MSPVGDVYFHAKKVVLKRCRKGGVSLGVLGGVSVGVLGGVYGVLVFWRLRRRYSSVRARFCADR